VLLDIETLVHKAWTDEAFKQELLRNPKQVIEREFSVTLPAELEIYIHEQTPTALHLILPMKPDEAQ
jgi:hypothetical protein